MFDKIGKLYLKLIFSIFKIRKVHPYYGFPILILFPAQKSLYNWLFLGDLLGREDNHFDSSVWLHFFVGRMDLKLD